MLRKFCHPVSIIVGLGFPRQIDSVDRAFAFLDEYPQLLRDEAYEATRDACLDVFSGSATTEEAYDVFCAFARRRGILIDPTPSDITEGNRDQLAA
ncbi:Protein of unknown function [Mesorhizobium albiziae]|uniref:DUF982 domain-containing protein n=1 Tax=Neomesorhizobium albiziae TaxID=335020 RepID=A0A1I4CT33_9HYPH|nr:hypothetical protein GCM10007937_30660 [Mesorhizobium albiziae]SFK84454.1 Protein of unknown function [Mesorhizobium albiziae]